MESNHQIFTPNKDFRKYLQDLLVERCQKNPSYSLRAFSKSLKLDHTTLSRILNNKRKITPKMQAEISEALNLSPEEKKGFALIEQKKPTHPPKQFKDLSEDVFQLIASWHHDVLMELPRLKHFRPDIRKIAKALKVTPIEVNAAIERLIRLELLQIDEKGNWSISEDTTNITSHISTSSAARKYQKEILSKAIIAVDEVDISLRDNTGLTFAVNTQDIPKIKEIIKKFRREISGYIQHEVTDCDEVYQLSVALFPLTQYQEQEN
ncbi:MAG: TIGR02147 family protein [Bacteriovoracaceae bacterium]